MHEHVIQPTRKDGRPRQLYGYRMLKPLNAQYNGHVDYPWFSENLGYVFSIGQGIGVLGRTMQIAERELLRSLVGAYKNLQSKQASELNEPEQAALKELGEVFAPR
ncbi:MAG: hypothetical protein HYW23_02950 [Candidatus Aenigmarchaeota archaeon]|nr:hypothetical protein [Candidatus Aenigmarchaeota archaeon]